MKNLNKNIKSWIAVFILISQRCFVLLLKGQTNIEVSLTSIFILFILNDSSFVLKFLFSHEKNCFLLSLGTVRVMAFISRCSFSFLSALGFINMSLKHKRCGPGLRRSQADVSDPQRWSSYGFYMSSAPVGPCATWAPPHRYTMSIMGNAPRLWGHGQKVHPWTVVATLPSVKYILKPELGIWVLMMIIEMKSTALSVPSGQKTAFGAATGGNLALQLCSESVGVCPQSCRR